MRKTIFCAIPPVTTLSVLSVAARAQGTATITGLAMEQSSDVVAGATVVRSNVEKRCFRALASDSAGVYITPEIPIGDYLIAATASGL